MRITIHESGHPPIEYVTDATEVVIGRAPSCDIVVDRPFVSGRHLRILGGVVAHDMGSTNGSYLAGESLDRPEWIDGRPLTVGGNELSVRIELDHRAESPAAQPAHDPYSTAKVEIIGQDPVEPPQPKVPEPAPLPAPAPIPRRSMPPVGEPLDGELPVLLELIDEDCRDRAPLLSGTVTEFYTVESFRFVRDVETLVSRLAGELANLNTNETVLPGASGNVMRYLSDIATQPDDTHARQLLMEHLDDLRRWLMESLTSYQRASVRLVEEIRSSLGPLELGRNEPMPKLQRALGLQEIELWKRAQRKLADLTPDVIAERLDELARAAASEVGR